MPSSACSAPLRSLPSFPTRRSSDLAGQLGPQRVGNRFRNVALNFENVGQLAIVNLGPEMRARECVDQLHIDPHLIVCSLHAAFEDVRSEEHTSELQSLRHLVCRLLLAPLRSGLSPLSLHDALPI